MDEPVLKSPVEPHGDHLIPASRNSRGLTLDPTHLIEVNHRRVDFQALQSLVGTSIVHADQLSRELVVELSKFAALLEVTEIASHHPLDGKLVVTAFFEASTRTRLSFESAVLRLDGKIVSVPDGKVTGIAKGESLSDIGEMFNTYGDLVVIRHPDESSVGELASGLTLPLINAGNGCDAHPTQALIDWYTLLKWRPELSLPEPTPGKKIRIGLIGTPGVMRSVNSFLALSTMFAQHIEKVTVITDQSDAVTPEGASFPIELTDELEPNLSDFDVIYMNSITYRDEAYERLGSRYKLNADSRLKESAVILHPFARSDELHPSLDRTTHNLYFAQAAGAVFLRQALLIAVLDRVSHLPPSLLLLTTV
jgi:aspartate carbamoyltransferase catalytic subunit